MATGSQVGDGRHCLARLCIEARDQAAAKRILAEAGLLKARRSPAAVGGGQCQRRDGGDKCVDGGTCEFGQRTQIDGLEVYLFEAEHPTLTPELLENMAQWGGAVRSRNGGLVVRGKSFYFCLLGDCIYSAGAGPRGAVPVQGGRPGL